MKLLVRRESLTDAIAWLTSLNRLLGTRAFEYPRGQPRPLLSLVYILFLFVIYCVELPMQNHFYHPIKDKLLKLEHMLFQLILYITATCVVINLTMGWCYTKSYKTCCRQLCEIDETLRRLGSTINYNLEYFGIMGILFGWFIGIFCITVGIFVHLQERTDIFSSICIIMSFNYSINVNNIIMLDFYVLVRHLKQNFQLVNQLLRLEDTSSSSSKVTNPNCFEMQRSEIATRHDRIFTSRQRSQTRNGPATGKRKGSHVPFAKRMQVEAASETRADDASVMMENQRLKHRLQTIKQVHLELCKVSKRVCAIFGVQIAWDMGMSIMLVTGLCYNLYVRFILQSIVYDVIQQIVMTFVWIMLNIVKFIVLNYSCQRAAEEGNKTCQIIHTMYGYTTDADIEEEIQQFGIQILQSPMAFSTFGVSLNNKFLTLILKSVTTYLVIMIQMSDSLESNDAVGNAKYI